MNLKKSINRLFFINYVLLAFTLASFIFFNAHIAMISILFMMAVVLSYAFVYLFPAGLLLSILNAGAKLLHFTENIYAKLLISALAVLTFTMTQLVILLDRVIYKMYGFHFNGFVWNLLTTKGGVESMGFDPSAYWMSGGAILTALGIETMLLIACVRLDSVKLGRIGMASRYLKRAMPYTASAMFLVQALFFGVSSFRGDANVLVSSRVFPFFVPITFGGILSDLGFTSTRNAALSSGQLENVALNYPLQPLRQRPDSPQYNIVWLVAESWRSDMLTNEIMPRTTQFAKQSQHFVDHHSGGNGTRQAMFSMFYGLYGNYWSAFLREQRSPVLMDLLQQNGYQIDLYTSARFTYPEFDKTLFSGIPAEHLHEYTTNLGWKSDRVNVTRMLERIDARDKNRPFMTFLFFESPHARYYFPPECELKKEYLKEFNYATADLENDIDLIFNRYINSCNHLDSQLARVIDYLDQNDLLDTTIVLITGDHGEEFMEHGRWGHNSAFVEEQVKTPLVMWLPGMKPADHTEMTSHLDIPSTLMRVLGVENPATDFSFGGDLFSGEERNYAVVADWDSMVYMDNDCKIILPFKVSASFAGSDEMVNAHDETLPNPSDMFKKKMNTLVSILQQSGTFSNAHLHAK